MIAGFTQIQVSYDVNFTIFVSHIFTSSTIRSWIDNDKSAVDCTSYSISAYFLMKRFITHCIRQNYMIAFIITEEHFP